METGYWGSNGDSIFVVNDVPNDPPNDLLMVV